MTSTFFGLELSRRALESQQIGLNVTGHNISNSNTVGYTRQTAIFQATYPYIIQKKGRDLSIGSGVTVDTIIRARSVFVDRQFREETSKQQYWTSQQDTLSKVEGILNEPSANSLSGDMTEFWTAWSDLSKEPENMGARAVVRERALTLTDSFHSMDKQITDTENDLDSSIRAQIGQINTIALQIQELNGQIKKAEILGDNPNDLRDKRDALVDDLSKIVSVHVTEGKDNTVSTDERPVNLYTVTIGDPSNPPLVDDGKINLLDDQVSITTGFAVVQWADGTLNTATTPDAWGNYIHLGINSGSLLSNIESRGSAGLGTDGSGGYLENLRSQFNALAQGIADAVNEIHKTGQGTTALAAGAGIDFFDDGAATPSSTTITAANISLSSAIITNPGSIATGLIATPVALGDGSVASAISSLAIGWSTATKPTGASPLATASSLGDYYGSKVTELGVKLQQADRMKAGEDVLLNNATIQRESVSGVSLDEEMANLIKFQKSYSAAARVVTMLDSMLDTIVNGMGITR
jgi:flagellar hook-associated protein 1 FlgK